MFMIMFGRWRLGELAMAGGAASLSAPFVARRALGDAPIHHLKCTMSDVSTHPIFGMLNDFAADVLKRTSGAVAIQVYGAGQLGSQGNALTGMQTGTIDLVCHSDRFDRNDLSHRRGARPAIPLQDQ
jgi:TRAP-type C4-dicarboxylate transport system substrate-binding protein